MQEQHGKLNEKAEQPVKILRWVKASERMPEKAGEAFSVILRGTGFEPDQFGHAYLRPFVTTGFKNFNEDSPKFYFLIGHSSFLTNDNIEWLEEIEAPAASPERHYSRTEVIDIIIDALDNCDENTLASKWFDRRYPAASPVIGDKTESKGEPCEYCENPINPDSIQFVSSRKLCDTCLTAYDNKTGHCSLDCSIGGRCDESC